MVANHFRLCGWGGVVTLMLPQSRGTSSVLLASALATARVTQTLIRQAHDP